MGGWNWSFLLGTVHHGCRFVWARVCVGTVAWSHFCFLSSIWLFRNSEPVISVVSIGHFPIRALDMVYSSSLGSC